MIDRKNSRRLTRTVRRPNGDSVSYPQRSALRNAAFLGREERFIGNDITAMFRYAGQPHHFQPEASLEFYGENPWFRAGIDVICFEVSRTQFFLEEKVRDDWDRVKKHESLSTLQNLMSGKTYCARLRRSA